MEALVQAELRSSRSETQELPVPAAAPLFQVDMCGMGREHCFSQEDNVEIQERPGLRSLLEGQPTSKLSALDFSRFKLSLPETSDPKDWEDAVNNARAQLAQQENRILNLELLGQFGATAWKAHNSHLEGLLDSLMMQLEAVRAEILEINSQRRGAQTEVSGSLSSMEHKWRDLVESTAKVDLANIALEKKVEGLRRRKEQTMAVAS